MQKTTHKHNCMHMVELVCIVWCKTVNLHHSGFLENMAQRSNNMKQINPFDQKLDFFGGYMYLYCIWMQFRCQSGKYGWVSSSALPLRQPTH
jgi:hypothetical protein